MKTEVIKKEIMSAIKKLIKQYKNETHEPIDDGCPLCAVDDKIKNALNPKVMRPVLNNANRIGMARDNLLRGECIFCPSGLTHCHRRLVRPRYSDIIDQNNKKALVEFHTKCLKYVSEIDPDKIKRGFLVMHFKEFIKIDKNVAKKYKL